MAQKTMTTEDIKKGLQNIKRAQLQVLKQLKADSYQKAQQASSPKENLRNTYQARNTQNQPINVNKSQQKQQIIYPPKSIQKRQLQYNQQQNLKRESLTSSTNTTTSSESIEKLKKEFSSEREQLNQRLIEITSKLNSLERQSQKSKNQEKIAQKTIQNFNEKVRKIEAQNDRLQANISVKDQTIQDLEKAQKKLRSQLQLKIKQNTILEMEIKSLRGENVKLSRSVKQLESQLKEQSVLMKQKKQEKLKRNEIQSRLNLDFVMNEVKLISVNHDFLFNKLKDSARTLEMQWVEKQSQIQTSFSKILEYFETLSMTNQPQNDTNEMISGVNGYNIKRQQSRQSLRREFLGSESIVEEQQELQYFVREMNKSNSARKQFQDLVAENDSLRKKLRQVTSELATYESTQPSIHNNNKRFNQSNRLIGLELQQMREQVFKLKRYKAQLKDQHEEQEKEIVKYKLKIKDLQNRLEIESKKIIEVTSSKFALEKKCQHQDIEITTLNSILKELNNKLSTKQSPQSPSLNQLRQQFSKLLETNSFIQKQSQSIKVINEGLQAQITTLKFEKSQLQANNKQKHQIIERQVKQKDRLVLELQKKDQKFSQLIAEIDKVKTTFIKSQEQFQSQKQNFENVIEQKSQQILSLRKEMEELYQQSRQSHQFVLKYEKLQSQFKEMSRKSIKMGETVTHLWSIKEAQYFNIHQILGSVRNTQINQVESQEQISGHF